MRGGDSRKYQNIDRKTDHREHIINQKIKEGLVRISYETGDNISLRTITLTKNVLFLLSYVGIFPIIYVFTSWWRG